MILDRRFSLQKVLGQGGSSKVFLASDSDSQKYAVKVLRKDKNYSFDHGANMIMKEHILMQSLWDHPNILKSYQANLEGVVEKESETENVMYNVLEFAEHGSLSFFIRTTGPIEEEVARFQFIQIANATEFIHMKNYAHLDLKLENILLDKHFNVKVADFGAAVKVVSKTKGRTNHRRGTVLYMAPEVLDLKSGDTFDALAADIYSLGVWLYVMLVGEFPNPQSQGNLSSTGAYTQKEEIDDMEVDKPQNIAQERWELLSKSVKDLVKKMLDPNPWERPKISEVLDNEWLSYGFTEENAFMVFQEMDARKEYIIKTFQKTKHQSNHF